ncbi:DUSP6 (predicted) [Pycnogonum litorale]
MDDNNRSPEWLKNQLWSGDDILVIDTRCHSEFSVSHVRDAINVTFPASTLMLRRLLDGKMPVQSIIKCRESHQKFFWKWKTHTLVLYDDSTVDINNSDNVILTTLYRRLVQDGCEVVHVEGGYRSFRDQYPEWCDVSVVCESDNSTTILGFKNLTITCSGDIDSEDSVDSGHDSGDFSPNDSHFPVEILPYLFLGNSKNSSDLEALDKHNIRSILNVTPNLPNVFEKDDRGIKYMQIPIQDHWSQNLSSFFPQAISFIDDSRQKKIGVLVHCLAGISRSVTITVAYLMQKMNMSMNEAYDFVRQRKANISPNFSFMGQLLEFEEQLGKNSSSGLISRKSSNLLCLPMELPKPSPDSDIELDNWS